MTDSQRDQILELRLKGIGYKAIGTQLGLSRESVRGYCKRNILTGNPEVVRLNVEEHIQNNHLCIHCGKFIRQKSHGRTRRFCSEECRRKWWKEHPEARKPREASQSRYACSFCGIEFMAYGKEPRKYCSHGCYIKSRYGE